MNEWWFKSFYKKFNLVIKPYKLNLLVSFIYLQFNFDTKFYFGYFLVPVLRDEIKRLSDSNVRVNTNFIDQNGRSWCQRIPFSERSFA